MLQAVALTSRSLEDGGISTGGVLVIFVPAPSSSLVTTNARIWSSRDMSSSDVEKVS